MTTTHEPKRVVLIGLGGIGSNFARWVVQQLEFHAPGSQVLFIDGDTFEGKNAERQHFSRLGAKAQIVRADLAEQFSGTILLAKTAWVVDEGEQSETTEEEGISRIAPSSFMQDGDVVFCMVDNYAARAIIFQAARKFDNIDVFTGGNGEDLTGYTYHYCRRGGKDVNAHPDILHPEFKDPPDKNPGAMSCEERAKLKGGTQILAANAMVATLLIAQVALLVLGTEEERERGLRSTKIEFDLAYGASTSYNYLVTATEEAAAELVAAEATA